MVEEIESPSGLRKGMGNKFIQGKDSYKHQQTFFDREGITSNGSQ